MEFKGNYSLQRHRQYFLFKLMSLLLILYIIIKKHGQWWIVAFHKPFTNNVNKLLMTMFLRLKRYSKLNRTSFLTLLVYMYLNVHLNYTLLVPQGTITSLVTMNLFLSSVSEQKLNTSLQGLCDMCFYFMPIIND